MKPKPHAVIRTQRTMTAITSGSVEKKLANHGARMQKSTETATRNRNAKIIETRRQVSIRSKRLAP